MARYEANVGHTTNTRPSVDDPLRILHIEDDPRDALLFATMVQNHSPEDFDITLVRSLESGLTHLAKSHYDAIVLDINLPRNDGARSIELINQSGSDVPVICISGCTDENTAFDMIKAGAQDFISKSEMVPEQTVRVIKYSIFRKQTERSLNILAQYDSLTGLPNRRLFDDRLDHAFSGATRNTSSLALIFLDLDDFKSINDSLGHAAGDALLKIASERLMNCVRDSDTVARLSGDEFVVLLEGNIDAEGAGTVATHILEAINQPFNLYGNTVSVPMSIGIALYPDSAETKSQLVARADEAMYQAKSRGKNNFQFYSEAMKKSKISHIRKQQ